MANPAIEYLMKPAFEQFQTALAEAEALPAGRWENASLRTPDYTKKVPATVSTTVHSILSLFVTLGHSLPHTLMPEHRAAAKAFFLEKKAALEEAYGDKPYWPQYAFAEVEKLFEAGDAAAGANE